MDFPEEEYGDANSAAVAALFRPNATSGALWRLNATLGAGDVNLTSESTTSPYDYRDQFQFVVYAVVGTVVNSFGFIGNILTLIVLFSMHPRTSVTLYIIGIALTDAVILSIGEIAIFLPRGLNNFTSS